MQTLFLKYFAFFIFVHFIFCTLTLISLFSYIQGVSIVSMGWVGLQPILIKSVVIALVVQALPVYLYYKWAGQE